MDIRAQPEYNNCETVNFLNSFSHNLDVFYILDDEVTWSLTKMMVANQPNTFEPVTTTYNMPTSYSPELWWHNTQSARAEFYEILKCFNCHLSPNALRRMRSKVMDAGRTMERVSYQSRAQGARECLLAAIDDMAKALTCCIDGDTERAHSYVLASKIELGILTQELDDLSLFCSETYIAAIHD